MVCAIWYSNRTYSSDYDNNGYISTLLSVQNIYNAIHQWCMQPMADLDGHKLSKNGYSYVVIATRPSYKPIIKGNNIIIEAG